MQHSKEPSLSRREVRGASNAAMATRGLLNRSMCVRKGLVSAVRPVAGVPSWHRSRFSAYHGYDKVETRGASELFGIFETF